MIEELERKLALLDAYGELLTLKQKEMFTYAYCIDLSLSEIAENMKISRSAVFDSLKRTLAILEDYEAKLHLVENSKKRALLYKTAIVKKYDLNELIATLIKIESN